MPYVHLKPNDRVLLSGYLRAGLKQKEIAGLLRKHPSTISRELARNLTPKGGTNYDAGLARRKTKRRRVKANQRFRKIEKYPWLEEEIEEKLKLYWSPEQISGRLRREFGRTIICHETIYQYLYCQRKNLKRYLRCQKRKYRRRYGTKIRERRRKKEEVRRIDQRPKVVEKRNRIGDWEGDTIVGKGGSKRGAILTYVDRKSGQLLADKLERATAEEVREKTIDRFKKVPKKKRLTFTYDNGTENADYELIERKLKVTAYFAYPYHSWERGTNENTNGLLRQFFPKKESLEDITQNKLARAVKLINNRPRKRLNYLTPQEVFEKNCTLS
jgi:transposase, IS30 family